MNNRTKPNKKLTRSFEESHSSILSISYSEFSIYFDENKNSLETENGTCSFWFPLSRTLVTQNQTRILRYSDTLGFMNTWLRLTNLSQIVNSDILRWILNSVHPTN